MKTLQQIKEEVAQDDNFQGWQELFEVCARYDYGRLESAINETTKRYATECAKEALRLASESAKTFKSGNSGSWHDANVDKQSILSETNLPKYR